MRRLPNLNALRAFEAAARHLSFTKAADELAVTQGAISHQVAALEAQLGIKLFERLNRRLRLTKIGLQYQPALTEAFDRIASATQELRSDEQDGALRVTVLPSFAQIWLMPKLHRFRERRPDIDVMLMATERIMDFLQEPVDLGIRMAASPSQGLWSERLAEEYILPVCAPHLVTEPPGLHTPDDLAHYGLLHDDAGENVLHDDAGRNRSFTNWSDWLRMVDAKGVDPNRGMQFSNSSFVIMSAVAGEGVALGKLRLCIEELLSGRLVQPFGPIMPTNRGYYLVTTQEKARWPKVRAFVEWIKEEHANFPSWPRPGEEHLLG